MQFQHLRAFLEVADELSFTQAARNLHYAQSSVTAQIRSLEEALGTPLFDRRTRRVELTEAGRQLRPYAEQILRIAAVAEAACRDAGAARAA
ncbi:LysR family transcriptional regulator [Kitasatospora sp. NPDC093558]|uniref:LysR family transcriptional regulator n=1 Tax=Kitasatospora sp. NPDC093558 TaxID=3155201 RepID=UPI003447099C